jgi:hypothetical protein
MNLVGVIFCKVFSVHLASTESDLTRAISNVDRLLFWQEQAASYHTSVQNCGPHNEVKKMLGTGNREHFKNGRDVQNMNIELQGSRKSNSSTRMEPDTVLLHGENKANKAGGHSKTERMKILHNTCVSTVPQKTTKHAPTGTTMLT